MIMSELNEGYEVEWKWCMDESIS